MSSCHVYTVQFDFSLPLTYKYVRGSYGLRATAQRIDNTKQTPRGTIQFGFESRPRRKKKLTHPNRPDNEDCRGGVVLRSSNNGFEARQSASNSEKSQITDIFVRSLPTLQLPIFSMSHMNCKKEIEPIMGCEDDTAPCRAQGKVLP